MGLYVTNCTLVLSANLLKFVFTLVVYTCFDLSPVPTRRLERLRTRSPNARGSWNNWSGNWGSWGNGSAGDKTAGAMSA